MADRPRGWDTTSTYPVLPGRLILSVSRPLLLISGSHVTNYYYCHLLVAVAFTENVDLDRRRIISET